MRVLPAREWRQHRPLAPELSSNGPASRHCVSQRPRTQGCRPRRHSRGRGGRRGTTRRLGRKPRQLKSQTTNHRRPREEPTSFHIGRCLPRLNLAWTWTAKHPALPLSLTTRSLPPLWGDTSRASTPGPRPGPPGRENTRKLKDALDYLLAHYAALHSSLCL